ncbi:MAG: thermonuclease family protein [Thermoanaerobaculia bacterium]
MKVRILFFLVSLSLVVRLDASMVRVIGVTDGQTLIVERGGAAVQVKLAGIELTDDVNASALMRWTLVSSWVMLDEQPGGGFYVYRSPDALFVNRELVARGFARATLPTIEPHQHVVVTYLGTLRGMGVRTPLVRQSGSGTSAPAPAKPSRSARRRK